MSLTCRWRVARLAFEHARNLVTLAFRSVSNIRLSLERRRAISDEDQCPSQLTTYGTGPELFLRGGRWGGRFWRDLACVEFFNQLLAITCRVMGRGLNWQEFPDFALQA